MTRLTRLTWLRLLTRLTRLTRTDTTDKADTALISPARPSGVRPEQRRGVTVFETWSDGDGRGSVRASLGMLTITPCPGMSSHSEEQSPDALYLHVFSTSCVPL